MKYFWRLLVALLLIAVTSLTLLFLCKSPNSDIPFALVFPGANSRPTYFSTHNIGAAHAVNRGEGIKVGILDHLFGTELHPELYAGGTNFLGEDGLWKLEDKDEHGYWMALVLKEIAPGVEVYALNTSQRDEIERAEAMAEAIEWAIANDLDVLTYSNAPFSAEARRLLDPAVEKAHAAGIVTAFIHYGHPGNVLPGALSIAPEDGREPDVNVLHYDYSVVFVKEYAKVQAGGKSDWYRPFLSMSSTSPVTAGVVAMIMKADPTLTPSQIQTLLRSTSKPIDWHGQEIPRCLDAAAAVLAAQGPSAE
jgi:hypothetical protein